MKNTRFKGNEAKKNGHFGKTQILIYSLHKLYYDILYVTQVKVLTVDSL